MVATDQDTPEFASQLLNALAKAFASRRKAIRYRSKSFEVSLAHDTASDEPSERLNADIQLLVPQNTKLRLSMWPDAAMWLWAGQSSKNGWSFEVQLEGILSNTTAAGIVTLFEESISLVQSQSNAPNLENLLRDAWSRSGLRSFAPPNNSLERSREG